MSSSFHRAAAQSARRWGELSKVSPTSQMGRPSARYGSDLCGRDRKKSFESGAATRRWINIVLSTYIFPLLLGDGKSCVSVAIGLIAAHYTILLPSAGNVSRLLEVPQFLLGWRGHPAPRLRRRPRRGATRSRTPTRRTRPRWRRTSMPRREIMRREARERLFFVSSSESRTTIQVNCELDLK